MHLQGSRWKNRGLDLKAGVAGGAQGTRIVRLCDILTLEILYRLNLDLHLNKVDYFFAIQQASGGVIPKNDPRHSGGGHAMVHT